MKLFGVGKTSVAEPELLVQSSGIDDERISFPMTAGISVVQRIGVIAANVALLRPSVGIYKVPLVVAAPGHYKNPSEGLVFQKLISIRHLKLAQRSGRLAGDEHWIIFKEIPLPILIKVARPFLEWCDPIQILDVFEQSVRICRGFNAFLHQ